MDSEDDASHESILSKETIDVVDRKRRLEADADNSECRRCPRTGAMMSQKFGAQAQMPSFALRTLSTETSTLDEGMSDLSDFESEWGSTWPIEELSSSTTVPESFTGVDPHTLYDVVSGPDGTPHLMPVDLDSRAKLSCPVNALPPDTVVDIRVLRFFEDQIDEKETWEQELRNVNSGSLLWLPVHLEPKFHSVIGSKFGKWFTIHHVRVMVKHFQTGYHMAEEGATFAKTFGATAGLNNRVTGVDLPSSYYWFVTPDKQGSATSREDVTDEANIAKFGWQHVSRQGPYDGQLFLEMWHQDNQPLQEQELQKVLHKCIEHSK